MIPASALTSRSQGASIRKSNQGTACPQSFHSCRSGYAPTHTTSSTGYTIAQERHEIATYTASHDRMRPAKVSPQFIKVEGRKLDAAFAERGLWRRYTQPNFTSFFRAVGEQLYGSQITHRRVRSELVSHLVRHADDYDALYREGVMAYKTHFDLPPSTQAYATRLLDFIFNVPVIPTLLIRAAVDMYRVPFIVYTSTAPEADPVEHTPEYLPERRYLASVVRLAQLDGPVAHFDVALEHEKAQLARSLGNFIWHRFQQRTQTTPHRTPTASPYMMPAMIVSPLQQTGHLGWSATSTPVGGRSRSTSVSSIMSTSEATVPADEVGGVGGDRAVRPPVEWLQTGSPVNSDSEDDVPAAYLNKPRRAQPPPPPAAAGQQGPYIDQHTGAMCYPSPEGGVLQQYPNGQSVFVPAQ